MLGFKEHSSSIIAALTDEICGIDEDDDGPDIEEEAAGACEVGDVVMLLLLFMLLFVDADEAFDAALTVADRTLFSSEPIDSSLCHLELSAALI